jgi:3-hydroxyisobutyrate dehydrogenase
MGTAMAKRLIAAGYDVSVTNRTASKTAPLCEIGATAVGTARDLASRDVVFIMVSANADLVEVTSGPNGVLSDETSAPKIIVDCSTVSAEVS